MGAKPRFLGFDLKDFGREKKKREVSLLSIFLSHLYFLQMSFFNLWKYLRDLKNGSRSANKMVFVRASTLEETDQIEALSELFVEVRYMCDCKQPARSFLPYLSIVMIIDPRSGIEFWTQIDVDLIYCSYVCMQILSYDIFRFYM